MARAVAAFVGIVLVGSGTVLAQNPDGAKLFEEGRALAKDGKYAEACDAFAKSLAIDPANGTKLNFGDCHEHLGHLAQAYRLYLEVAEGDKTANPDRAKFAQSRADALVPKLGTVVVKVPEPITPTTQVTIAGRIVPAAAEITEKVDPGDVVVEVNTAGGQPFTRTAAAKAGTTIVVDASAAAVGGGGQVPETPEPGTARRKSRVYLAIGLGGVGVASLATAGALGLVANSRYNAQIGPGKCSDAHPPVCANDASYDAMNHAITLAHVGTGFAIGGAVLVAAGAVVFFTAPRDLMVTPAVSSESAGVSVVGRF